LAGHAGFDLIVHRTIRHTIFDAASLANRQAFANTAICRHG
jgi:hypothetical protein